jgi:hypothetical protein
MPCAVDYLGVAVLVVEPDAQLAALRQENCLPVIAAGQARRILGGAARGEPVAQGQIGRLGWVQAAVRVAQVVHQLVQGVRVYCEARYGKHAEISSFFCFFALKCPLALRVRELEHKIVQKRGKKQKFERVCHTRSKARRTLNPSAAGGTVRA